MIIRFVEISLDAWNRISSVFKGLKAEMYKNHDTENWYVEVEFDASIHFGYNSGYIIIWRQFEKGLTFKKLALYEFERMVIM